MSKRSNIKVYKMCEHCGQLLTKISFSKHKCKQWKNTDEHSSKKKNEPKVFKMCQKCGEQSYSKSAFYRHKCDVPKKRANYKCDCGLALNYFKNFARHMKDVHHIDVNKEEVHDFPSYSEFTKWLVKFQIDTKSEFCERKKTTSKDIETRYFYCTRSGTYQEKQKRIRAPRKVGSKKIGRTCTARLKVETSKESVKAFVNPIHYGHENDLHHVHLDQPTKDELEQSLCDGIPSSRILKNIFIESTSTELKRKHLVTKTDLDNIKLSIKRKALIIGNDVENLRVPDNTKENRKHAINSTSVEKLIEENKESILFYKKQDMSNFFHPSSSESSLEEVDFALGVMTPFQKSLLKKYCQNIVCIDVTHGTTEASFLLVSVSVIDERGESNPVAWLLCNRVKDTILELFFEYIKISVGTISPKYFMSGTDSEYFSIWQEVFPADTRKLLSHQNVCNVWKKQLDEHMIKIYDKDAANKLSEMFSFMLNERDENNFHKILESFLNEIFSNESTKHLGHYFVSEWVPIAQQWANCFRVGIEINFDEAFIKKMEAFFNGKKGKSIEKILITLLDHASEIAQKKLIKDEFEPSQTSTDIMEIETTRNSEDTCTVYNLKDSLVKRMKKSCEELETVEDFSKLKRIEDLVSSLEEILGERVNKSLSLEKQYIKLLSEDGNYFTYEVKLDTSL